jgi:hypothetical protein
MAYRKNPFSQRRAAEQNQRGQGWKNTPVLTSNLNALC